MTINFIGLINKPKVWITNMGAYDWTSLMGPTSKKWLNQPRAGALLADGGVKQT